MTVAADMALKVMCEKLHKNNISEFLSSFDNILTDCDGIMLIYFQITDFHILFELNSASICRIMWMLSVHS